ncbi:MAG: polysaccharide deacetylase [Desulfovibrio sp.]|uniref:polysaccharide deacetylase family protein n=1 Tax=Desulfovibrio sp. 7SRBS1 TaxID=3378064 RepID=UPI003B41AC29
MDKNPSRIHGILFFGIFIALLLCLAIPSRGTCAHKTSQEVLRNVLVLYDSSNGQTAYTNNFFHQGLALIFNYYGLDYEYLDINKTALPDDAHMARYRAVISVFESMSMRDPAVYLKWLLHQMDMKRKVLVFGWLGTQYPNDQLVNPDLAAKVYERFGLRYLPNKTINKSLLHYDHKATGYVEFERNYPMFPPFDSVTLAPIEGKAQFLLTAKERNTDFVTAYISISPYGGFALAGSIYWMDPSSFAQKWYLNPFAFCKAALGLDDFPAPDPTTISGLRAALAHVDADGFSGFTNIDTSANCAQVMRDEVFKKYDFPTTSSIIAAEVNPADMGNPKLVETARSIFALPNIEPASHAYTHPFYWDMSKKAADEDRFDVAGAYSAPDYIFNATLEIKASCAYVSTLSPPEKPCKVILWSGMCNPTRKQVIMANKDGLLNMNGGDTVFDQAHDSLFTVSGLYKKLGDQYQIYTGQANENILTNLWTGPYWGFNNIIETMIRTNTPRRLKPIDIYYHFYSAEKVASLNALKQVYDWVTSQPLAPVFTSQYIEMVLGFTTTKIRRIEPGSYEVSNFGKCTTMRFAPDSPAPDLRVCSNVAGWVRRQQGLYVTLDAGTNKALIVFTGEGGKARPFVRQATGTVSNVLTSQNTMSLHYSGWGNGWMELAGLQPNKEYTFSVGGKAAKNRTNKYGRLHIENATTGEVVLNLK